MDNTADKVLKWIKGRPFLTSGFALFALFTYSNIFVFGFLSNVPLALRPFLDGYFYSTLALEFFFSVAIATVLSRFLLLSLRYIFSNFPLKPSAVIKAAGSLLSSFFEESRLLPELDRQTLIRLKLVSRWMRRQRIGLSVFLALLTFAVIFLGKHTIWFLPLSMCAAPMLWILVSRVELRRNFALPSNTKSMSSSRVFRAVTSFFLIYAAFCTLISGIASFAKKLDTEVSIAIDASAKNGSLIAVTNAGVVVADSSQFELGLFQQFSVSAYFIPFDRLDSIGQRNFTLSKSIEKSRNY